MEDIIQLVFYNDEKIEKLNHEGRPPLSFASYFQTYRSTWINIGLDIQQKISTTSEDKLELI